MDPDHARPFSARIVDGFLHFLRDLRRIRSARAKHNLKSRIHELNGAGQMNDPFLPRDAADEKKEWLGGVDSETSERVGRIDFVILIQIDSVVDNRDASRIDIEQSLDVLFRLA